MSELSPPEIAAIRFGHGLSPHHPLPKGEDDLLAALSGPDDMAAQWPIVHEGEGARMLDSYWVARKAADSGAPEDVQRYKQARRSVIDFTRNGATLRFARILDAPVTFRERLHQFWIDHFTTITKIGAHRGLQMEHHDLAIRPHMTGPFRTLLRHAVTHRMMLIYLDQITSKGPGSVNARAHGGGVNENLAREILELHTLGVGNGYTQTDVRQFALLLTGLGQGDGRMVFRPNWAEPGAETVLGRDYGGGKARLEDIHAALDDLARHPDTARHIARKLAVHFVADTPDEDLVDTMAAAYSEADTDLMAVYRAMLGHPSAWRDTGAKARQPFDWLAASMRGLGITGERLTGLTANAKQRFIMRPMMRMGQPWQAPNGPDGWPEEADRWLTPPGIAERIDWAMTAPARLLPRLPDPRRLVADAVPPARAEPLATLVPRAERQAEGVALVLASPEFGTR